MKILFLSVGLAVALMSCSNEPQVPKEWATTVTRPVDKAPASCDQRHQLTEPQGASGKSLVRFGNAATDDYAKLKADYEACATWAKGQRK